MRLILAILLLISSLLPSEAIIVRIKDITNVQGLRDYYLTGYGLVAGLPSNSGDRNNVATNLAQINMLENFGINIRDFLINNQIDVANLDMKNPGQAALAALRQINGGAVGNVAAVMITAKVGPYSKEGDKFDVDISSFSTARNLTGGVLLQSFLKGPDGKVYAAAQGPVISAGYEIEANGSLIREGSPNSGRIPEGGMIEFPLPTAIDTSQGIILTTEKIDFATTKKIVDTINTSDLNRKAEIIDGRTVRVILNGEADNPIAALAGVGALTVDAENEAKVVIMERTGTIVVGEDVKLSPVALSHGGISITVRTNNNISQPFVNTLANVNTATDNATLNTGASGNSPTGGIQTQSFSNSVIDFNESYTKYVELQESTSLAVLVKELNKIGIKARDMVAIMQALKASGALRAELEII
ncbi:MAG: flagellar basal body P-ring protein FlgI [Candidatus Caenarcaniphilales bacterium]|nr:flagellar basal body P-ring protein FlgI [Candidatus Caenarcaniphilales bacterium]